MPPSFVTPSPHRFIIQSREPRRSHQQSISSRGRLSVDSSSIGRDISRFAQAPRFNFNPGKAKDDGSTRAAPSPLRREIPSSRSLHEQIEESLAQESEDEDMLDSGPAHADSDDVLPSTDILVKTSGHKRRRLSPSGPPSPHPPDGYTQADSDSALHNTNHQLALAGKRPATTRPPNPPSAAASAPRITPQRAPPRFVFPNIRAQTPVSDPSFLASSSTTTPGPLSASSTRRFLLPPADSAHSPRNPLPEAFSPHRRGQKFLSGGMASEVREWVVEAGQRALAVRKGYSAPRVERGVVRVVVGAVRYGGLVGEGVIFVIGREAGRGLEREEEKRWVLVGGQNTGRVMDGHEVREEQVKRGDMLAVGSLTWTICVEGEVWIVCVDWSVMASQR